MALYLRHEALVHEFVERGCNHHSPLEKRLATGSGSQETFINTASEQKELLKNKPCECLVHV